MLGLSMHLINHLCTYAHQTELSVCVAQIIAYCADRLNMATDLLQEGQHPLTGQRAPPISGGT